MYFPLGFALWDRKTMIRPFEDKVKVIETRLDANEKAIKDPHLLLVFFI